MSDVKEISIFTGGLAGGGAEKVCVTIANGLSELGWVVNLIVLDSSGAKYHRLVDKSVNMVFLNTRVRYSLFKIYSYLKENPTKLAFSFSHELTVLLVFVRYLVGFNFKIISRNINNLKLVFEYSDSFWVRRLIFLLVRYFYIKSDFIINQCQAMESSLLNWLPSLKGKTTFIYNPVNTKALRSHAELHFDEDFILCVGRLEKQKDFYSAIQAFSTIHKLYPELRLYIIGDGSLRESLIKHAKSLAVDSRIRFISFTPDIGAYYKHAKLTLLTSVYEGFPNVLVESITLGTPIVAFDCVSGPREIIINGENGFLVEQGCVDSLSEKICTCLNTHYDKEKIKATSIKYSEDTIIYKYHEYLTSKLLSE